MENLTCSVKDEPTIAYSQLSELVRGEERNLLESIGPLVSCQSIILDLGGVERIDAAGISALIQLYATALQAGHEFTLISVSPRVAQILALVGLDRILLSQDVARLSHSDVQMDRSAA
jgi:anti-anti-sigma factor